MNILIKGKHENFVIPFKSHERDFCYDCVAVSKTYIDDNRIQYGLEILNEVKEVNKTDYRRIIINEKQFYKSNSIFAPRSRRRCTHFLPGHHFFNNPRRSQTC